MRLALVALLGWSLAPASASAQARVELTFTKNVTAEPFTGRVFVVATRQPIKDGAFRQPWFTPSPFFAQDVKGWRPGTPLVFEPQHHSPQHWAKLPPGKYYLQALLD